MAMRTFPEKYTGAGNAREVPNQRLFASALAFAVILALSSCGAYRHELKSTADSSTTSAVPRASSRVHVIGFATFQARDIGRPGTPILTHQERAQLKQVERRVSPKYLGYLRFAFVGSRKRFAVFVGKDRIPPDFGAGEVMLNDCSATPNCKYLCGGEIRYDEDGISALSSQITACEDGALYFYRDFNMPFPAGQKHGARVSVARPRLRPALQLIAPRFRRSPWRDWPRNLDGDAATG